MQWLDGAIAAVLPGEYASLPGPLVLLPPSGANSACSASGLYTDTLQCLRFATTPPTNLMILCSFQYMWMNKADERQKHC